MSYVQPSSRQTKLRRFELHSVGSIRRSWWTRPGKPMAQPDLHSCERPVLLVYGFLGVQQIVRALARNLGHDGRCVLWFDLGGLLGRFNASRIDVVARRIATAIDTLAAERPLSSIDIVGHSEGGLIGRYYVQKLGGHRRVRKLVTLGTPHRGVPLAWLGYLATGIQSLAQMAPTSPFLRELRDEEFPCATQLTSIYCRRDVICPPSSCRVDTRFGPHLKNIELTDGTHLELIYRKAIFDLIRDELGLSSPRDGEGFRLPAAYGPNPSTRAGSPGRVERQQ